MSNIADLLKEYSKESAEIQDDLTPNTEDTADVLDEIIDEVEIDEEEGAVLSEESVKLSDSINVLFDATFSLESSVDFLDQLSQESRLTDTSIAIFNTSIVESLEARGIPVEFLGDDVVFSTESSTEDKEEKKQGFFRRVWEMIKRAFQRVREWITRFLGWFRKSGSAVKSAAEKLKAKVEEKKKNNATAEGRKFHVKPFGDISVGGKVDGLSAVKVLTELSRDVLTKSTAIVSESNKAAELLRNEAPSENFVKRIFDTITKTKKEYASALAGVVNKPYIKLLPGERELDVKVEDTKKGLKAKVSVTKRQSVPDMDRWQDVMALDNIGTMADNLIKLVDATEKSLKDYNDAVSNAGLKDLKGFKVNVHESHKIDAAQIRELSALIVQGNTVAQQLTSKISGIIFPVAKRVYVLGVVNLRQYK